MNMIESLRFLVLANLCVLAFSSCATEKPGCRSIILQPDMEVSIDERVFYAPIDGGHGPTRPALGLLLREEHFSTLKDAHLLRASLWKLESPSLPQGQCKSGFLMRKPVVECSSLIDDFGLVLVGQFSAGSDTDFGGQREAMLSMLTEVEASLQACER